VESSDPRALDAALLARAEREHVDRTSVSAEGTPTMTNAESPGRNVFGVVVMMIASESTSGWWISMT
jgi:hypothetical protein